jgi:hypothetical protein
MMGRKVIMSQSLLRAMAEEKRGNRPYTPEQQKSDAEVGQRVQEFVRTQREGAEVLQEFLGKSIVF